MREDKGGQERRTGTWLWWNGEFEWRGGLGGLVSALGWVLVGKVQGWRAISNLDEGKARKTYKTTLTVVILSNDLRSWNFGTWRVPWRWRIWFILAFDLYSTCTCIWKIRNGDQCANANATSPPCKYLQHFIRYISFYRFRSLFYNRLCLYVCPSGLECEHLIL